MAIDQKLYMTFDNYVWFYVYFVFFQYLVNTAWSIVAQQHEVE